MLAIRVDGQLELFEEGHFLDTAWRLSERDASLTEADFPSEYVGSATGEIDVTDQGKIEVHFVDNIHRQLRLLGVEPGWERGRLDELAGPANCCRMMIDSDGVDVVHSSGAEPA